MYNGDETVARDRRVERLTTMWLGYMHSDLNITLKDFLTLPKSIQMKYGPHFASKHDQLTKRILSAYADSVRIIDTTCEDETDEDDLYALNEYEEPDHILDEHEEERFDALDEGDERIHVLNEKREAEEDDERIYTLNAETDEDEERLYALNEDYDPDLRVSNAARNEPNNSFIYNDVRIMGYPANQRERADSSSYRSDSFDPYERPRLRDESAFGLGRLAISTRNGM